jgi:hypothetical protein
MTTWNATNEKITDFHASLSSLLLFLGNSGIIPCCGISTPLFHLRENTFAHVKSTVSERKFVRLFSLDVNWAFAFPPSNPTMEGSFMRVKPRFMAFIESLCNNLHARMC